MAEVANARARVNLRMRDVLNRDDVSDLNATKSYAGQTPNRRSRLPQDLLIKARDLYQAGRDDEALPELHRVVMIEPTNAEAYLLSGRINLRRSDQEAAIAALKTAIFWDPKTDRRAHPAWAGSSSSVAIRARRGSMRSAPSRSIQTIRKRSRSNAR